MKRLASHLACFVAALVGIPLLTPAAAQILPRTALNNISASSNTDACPQPGGGDSLRSEELAPFHESVAASHVCEAAAALGGAALESVFSAGEIQAWLLSQSTADLQQTTGFSIQADSTFALSFEVAADTAFRLSGRLGSQGTLTGQVGSLAFGYQAQVSLVRTAPTNESIVAESVLFNPDGTPLETPILLSGTLVPGTYLLQVNALNGVANWTDEPLGGSAQASLRIRFGSICDGDINGDGEVGLGDLALLLSEFGSSGGVFDGDLDGDGEVGLADLATLLANFGIACE